MRDFTPSHNRAILSSRYGTKGFLTGVNMPSFVLQETGTYLLRNIFIQKKKRRNFSREYLFVLSLLHILIAQMHFSWVIKLIRFSLLPVACVAAPVLFTREQNKDLSDCISDEM